MIIVLNNSVAFNFQQNIVLAFDIGYFFKCSPVSFLNRALITRVDFFGSWKLNLRMDWLDMVRQKGTKITW